MFQGEDEYWWETVRDGAEISEEEFILRFLVEKISEKYILEMVIDKLTLELTRMEASSSRVDGSMGSSVAPVQRSVSMSRGLWPRSEGFSRGAQSTLLLYINFT